MKTVTELIEALKHLPKDAKVFIRHPDYSAVFPYHSFDLGTITQPDPYLHPEFEDIQEAETKATAICLWSEDWDYVKEGQWKGIDATPSDIRAAETQ